MQNELSKLLESCETFIFGSGDATSRNGNTSSRYRSANQSEVYIYHETQESMFCGQHCLNNLLQSSIYNVVDLSTLAQELDALERSVLQLNEHSRSPISNNVDNNGNFSFDVLNYALNKVCEVDLISWAGNEGRTHEDLSNESGFIINSEHHWFAIRKIKDNWWNLDSLLEKPQHISSFYLEALLSQFREDNCAIFLIRGILPECGTIKDNSSDEANVIWWEESRLLGDAPNGRSSAQRPAGNIGVNSDLYGDENDEDIMLAIALSESMNNNTI